MKRVERGNRATWWWVLFQHEDPRIILAYLNPETPAHVVREVGRVLADHEAGELVDLGAWPRRSNYLGFDGMVLAGMDKLGLLTEPPTKPERTLENICADCGLVRVNPNGGVHSGACAGCLHPSGKHSWERPPQSKPEGTKP